LQQVFINLLRNACDALQAARFPRRIRVQVLSNSNEVQYIFEDNGPGISEEQASRLFEPFFTTKKHGDGTGLGLSISLSLVEQHRGKLRFEPGCGSGARFVVTIPRAGRSDRPPPPTP
jgi:signal transduction histidine kinase